MFAVNASLNLSNISTVFVAKIIIHSDSIFNKLSVDTARVKACL